MNDEERVSRLGVGWAFDMECATSSAAAPRYMLPWTRDFEAVLVKLLSQVRADERERCAKIGDTANATEMTTFTQTQWDAIKLYQFLIRAGERT